MKPERKFTSNPKHFFPSEQCPWADGISPDLEFTAEDVDDGFDNAYTFLSVEAKKRYTYQMQYLAAASTTSLV